MKLLNIKNIVLTVPLLFLAMADCYAQTCSTSTSPWAVNCDASGLSWTTDPLTVNSGATIAADSTPFYLPIPVQVHL